MTELYVLGCFDGMSCGQIALERAGFVIKQYYASEIDKHAIKVTQANYPDTIQLGDIRNVRITGFGLQVGDQLVGPVPDLILAGSPCQGFSKAGKGLNFEDPRSALFFEFVRILKEARAVNPEVKFLLENVEMIDEWLNIISKEVGISPVRINSALICAQNRLRYYWTNIGASSDMFGHIIPGIMQPKDTRQILSDVLEDEVDAKFLISDAALQRMFNSHPKFRAKDNADGTFVQQGGTIREDEFIENQADKAMNIDANYWKGPDQHGQRTVVQMLSLYENNADAGRVYSSQAKARTLKGEAGGMGGKMGLYAVERKCHQVNPNKESAGVQPYQQNRVYDSDGIVPALNAELSSGSHAIVVHNKAPRTGGKKHGGTGHLSRKDGKTYSLDTQSDTNQVEFRGVGITTTKDGRIRPHRGDKKKSGLSEIGTIATEESKASAIIAEHPPKVLQDVLIRRLTPVECERLQGVPDNYTNHVSDTQRYRMLGNGWQVDTIVHILKHWDVPKDWRIS